MVPTAALGVTYVRTAGEHSFGASTLDNVHGVVHDLESAGDE